MFLFAVIGQENENMDDADVKIAIAAKPTTLDPRFATGAASQRILDLVTPGLVRLKDDFSYEYVIADRIETQNQQVFNVFLKDIFFVDGSPVTAFDVVNYYQDIIAGGSPFKGVFRDVSDIRVVDNHSFKVELVAPNPWFWSTFELPIAKLDENIAEHPVGVGPFTIQRVTEHGDVYVSRGDQSVGFIYVKDPSVRLLKLQSGEVDIIHNDMPVELVTYAEKQGLNVFSTPSTSYTYLGVNMELGVTANKDVRRALSLAINRDAIIKTLLGGYATSADSLLLPAHPAYVPQKTIFDVDKAKSLLESYQKPVQLRLSVTTNPFILRIAQIIQQQLKDVGVDVVIESSEWGAFYGNIKKGNFESYILTWVGQFQPDFFNSAFHSSMMPPNGLNRGRYASVHMDTTLDYMMGSLDETLRLDAAREVQKLQYDDMVYIPLWRKNHVAITSDTFKSYTMPQSGGYEGVMQLLR